MNARAILAGAFVFVFTASAGQAIAAFVSNFASITHVSITTAHAPPPPPEPPAVRLFALADNELREEEPTDNLGAEKDAEVTSKSGENTRLLLQFDLGALPPAVTITSCELGLYMTEAPSRKSRQHELYRLTAYETTWGEGHGSPDDARPGESSWRWSARPTSWTTPGGDLAPTPTTSAATGITDNAWLTWDVLADCDTLGQRSWLVKDSAENDPEETWDVEYETRESNHFGRRPYLAVRFEHTHVPMSHIVINEFQADVEAGMESKNEWVELYNPTANTIDLTGWQLCDDSACQTLPAGTSITPQNYLVITPDESTWKHWPAVPLASRVVLDEEIGGGLGNDGDRIVLRDAGGAVVDELSYEEDMRVFDPAIPGAAAGWSLDRVAPGYDTDRALDFWTNPAPTPGQ